MLTVIPLPSSWTRRELTAHAPAYSVYWFPWVGVVLSILLWGVYWILPSGWPDYLIAAVLATVWVAVTGAIHLDGLADSADALVAGHQSRDKIHKVLKDPTCGSMAVVVLCVHLLLKFCLLWALYSTGKLTCALLWSMSLARLSISGIVLFTPYSGSSFHSQSPFGAYSWWHVINACVLAAVLFWAEPAT